jgi:TetR/AcrR family fatty acid metabolism transcriptional regulator
MEVPQPFSLKERQRQEREDLILQVAEDVLLEKGYRDTSMDEIAARVGIAKGTLYLHFSKKEDLMLAFFKREMQKILDGFRQICSVEQPAQAKLEAIVQSLHQEPFARHGQLLFLLINSEDFQITLKQQSKSILKEISNEVSKVLDEGKASGDFDPTIPTPIMVGSFFSLFSPLVYRFQSSETYTHADIVHFIECIYFRGIGGKYSFEKQR